MVYEDIYKIFPEIHEIKDKVLQQKSADALISAMEIGGWDGESVYLAPVTMNWQGCTCSLVEHIRLVTRMCMDDYKHLKKFYQANGVEFEWDIIVCGALLHDLGKFTGFVRRNGVIMHGEDANLLRHPLSGAILAAKAGLPDKIIHLIATHSFEGERSYQTAESAFVRAIDDFVFKCTVYGLKQGPVG
ncbi:HD domain-containing protein [Lawsonibacter asaccharolyticus]|uniref:HD domain-containing protein n=1 Tax=Eubacteriales TaxID=186802 RepID=UPI0023F0FE0C|nr:MULTISPECIES: HD domain-containing protein [Eubacteriales]UMM46919.1 HD domain-containing protein [Lawsonibacter asaccharolyticus]